MYIGLDIVNQEIQIYNDKLVSSQVNIVSQSFFFPGGGGGGGDGLSPHYNWLSSKIYFIEIFSIYILSGCHIVIPAKRHAYSMSVHGGKER